MKWKLTLTNDEKKIEVITGRSSLWTAQDFSATLPDTPSRSNKADYAWAYYAAKQAGKLEELGVEENDDVLKVIEYLGDTYDLISEDYKKSPLAHAQEK